MKSLKIMLLGISIILLSVAYAILMQSFIVPALLTLIAQIFPVVGVSICIIGYFYKK